MFLSIEKLQNEIVTPDKPDPVAASALQEILGGKFGEMRVMLQYMFQTFNFRGEAKQFRDLIRSIAAEEIGHVELVSYTINMMLEGATKPTHPTTLPLATSLNTPNADIHHFLVAGQSSRPVDAVGNPFLGTYIYDSGHLSLNCLYNLIGEATGTLQMCRLYQMSDNRAFRSTLAFLIARDYAHQKAWAKGLEALGVNWSSSFPIPAMDVSKMPEVQAVFEKNIHNMQWTFAKEGESKMSEIFNGKSPFGDEELQTIEGLPDGFNVPKLPQAPQEFSPNLQEQMSLAGKRIPDTNKSDILRTAATAIK